MPVGRLDFMTEGLLLLTNDGELKRQLELPKTGVVRRYRARAFGDVTQAQLEELAEGVTIDGFRYGSIDANLERRTGRNCWIEMALTEGKNSSGGRNNNGRVTTRYRGGGHKRQYRAVDFRRDKTGIPATVAAIEYDPNRSARLARRMVHSWPPGSRSARSPAIRPSSGPG